MRKQVSSILYYVLGLLLLFFGIIHNTYYILPTFAADSSSSAESSGSSSLIDKINQLKTEIASKAAKIKDQISQKLQNKAVVGQVTGIEGDKITVQTINNVRTFLVNEYTKYNSKSKNQKAKLSEQDIKLGDQIAALGDMDDKNILTAKSLIFLTPISSDSAKMVWGQIQAISGNIILVKDKDGAMQKIKTNFETNFQLGSDEAAISDAMVSKFLIAKGDQLSANNLTAKFIYYIPSMGLVKPDKKAASPSATASASPSAKPKK